jgi:Cys-tRNA synthase (O-phospho-L-seryl-tRNA:Cys-tRNA synthase)
MDTSNLSATQAREKILEFADSYSFETVCLEIVNRMTGDEAREFVEHFHDVVMSN